MFMYGALIGDIVGSQYEFNNVKTKDFPLFTSKCFCTDDSIMTIAIASALLCGGRKVGRFKRAAVKEMRRLGRMYPRAGYGGLFARWLQSRFPRPYNSLGNGAAMRVSPCGLIADTLDEALALAKASAEVTHNHPEGIKGAQATAAAVFLAKKGKDKGEIREYIQSNYYSLEYTVDGLRPRFCFNETCQWTVPPAIIAFLESDSFEDAIRNAISLGGDSDTLAAITGAIAWTYYGREGITEAMQSLWDQAFAYVPEELKGIIDEFESVCGKTK